MRTLYFSIVLFFFVSSSFCEGANFRLSSLFTLISSDDTTEVVKLVSTTGNQTLLKFRGNESGAQYILNAGEIIELKGDTIICSSFEKKEYRNPFQTHDVFTPTARMLKQKQFSFQNKSLLFNSASVGITDFAAMGAGFIYVPGLKAGFIEIESQVVPTFGVKLGTEIRKNLHIAAGYRAVVTDIYSHIPYVASTYAGEQKRLTIGVQALFNENNEPARILSLSGAISPHQKMDFLVEGMYVYQEETFYETIEKHRDFLGSFVFRPHGNVAAFDIGIAFNFMELLPTPIFGMALVF